MLFGQEPLELVSILHVKVRALLGEAFTAYEYDVTTCVCICSRAAVFRNIGRRVRSPQKVGTRNQFLDQGRM